MLLTYLDHKIGLPITYFAFNATKTKLMLPAIPETKPWHKLDQIKDLEIKCMKMQWKFANERKLQGVTTDDHLDWKPHINTITKECYATLLVLKKLKRCTPFQETTSWIPYTSNLNNRNILFDNIPNIDIKTLHDQQFLKRLKLQQNRNNLGVLKSNNNGILINVT